MKLLQTAYNWLFTARNERCDRAVTAALAQGIKTTLDLADATGLSLGTIYVVLHRLEKQGLVYSEWDEDSAHFRGGNRRKYYYLMSAKMDYLEERMLWGRDGR